MKICYVDEAGCTGAMTSSTCQIQPALIISGLMIDYSELHRMTESWLNLKQTFYPKLAPTGTTHMGWILPEVKGSDVRKNACDTSRSVRRHAMGFVDKSMKILEEADAKLAGRVWVKGIGKPLNGTSVYTFSIQSIYTDFQNYLTKTNDVGVVILDGRLKHLNTPVAHSVFTQKFKGTGDAFDRIIELPAFSHSDNHAGLQFADLICSAVMTPIAVNTFCEGHVTNVHVRPGYADIRRDFASRVKKLQHRYTEASGRSRGGFVVSDELGKKPGGDMFR